MEMASLGHSTGQASQAVQFSRIFDTSGRWPVYEYDQGGTDPPRACRNYYILQDLTPLGLVVVPMFTGVKRCRSVQAFEIDQI